MRQVTFGFLLVYAIGITACGKSQNPTSSIRALETGTTVGFAVNDSDTYQIGTEMGKVAVTAEQMSSETAFFTRMAKATAKVRSATGFYLGAYNDFHIVATNHHVCPSQGACLNQNISFPMLGNRQFKVIKFFGTWDNVDLALFAIEVRSTSEAEMLAEVANNFDFAAPPSRGAMLTTMGFGIANNPQRVLFANQDSDCKVFSPADDVRLMADPDELNPGPYKAWSFSNGCDVSHGDSGSAMMDRETGKIVGIIWTGKIPKNAQVRQPGYTDRVFNESSEEMWSELSLAVPATKIREHLESVANNPATSSETAKSLTALIAE